MDWHEEQKKKLFLEYSSGNITTEQFDKMADALSELSKYEKQSSFKKFFNKKVTLPVALLTMFASFFIFKEAFSFISFRKIVMGENASQITSKYALNDNEFLRICQEESSQYIIDAINKGANVNAKSVGRDTPLMYGILRDLDSEVIAALIERGADVNARMPDGMTPLIAAVSSSNASPEKIAILIKAGADVNARVTNGATPLIKAAKDASNPEVITFLLNSGADLNAKDDFGKIAIDYAKDNSKLNDTYAIKSLSEASVLLAGLMPSAVSNSDFINLCKKGSLQLINEIIENGFNVNARDKGWTPLMAAASDNSNPDVIIALIRAGAKVNSKNILGKTPLSLAAVNNSNPEVIVALINAGADVNVNDSDGRTPLMLAARDNSNPEVITVLIKAGAEVNAKSALGRTPLMYAAQHTSNPEVITTLLNKVADFKTKDNSGKMAVDYARGNSKLNENNDIIKRLSGSY